MNMALVVSSSGFAQYDIDGMATLYRVYSSKALLNHHCAIYFHCMGMHIASVFNLNTGATHKSKEPELFALSEHRMA